MPLIRSILNRTIYSQNLKNNPSTANPVSNSHYYQGRYGMPAANVQNEAVVNYQLQPRTVDLIYQAILSLIAPQPTTFVPSSASAFPVPSGPYGPNVPPGSHFPPPPPYPGQPVVQRPSGPFGPPCAQYPCRPPLGPPCAQYPCRPPLGPPCGAYPCRPPVRPACKRYPCGPPYNPPPYPPMRYPCRNACPPAYPNYDPGVNGGNYPPGFATTISPSIIGIIGTSSSQSSAVAVIGQVQNPAPNAVQNQFGYYRAASPERNTMLSSGNMNNVEISPNKGR